MAENIDADVLISLVEERPVLWDKTNNYYKDKYLKTSAWKEICQIIFPSFEDQTNKAKTKLVRDVVKKWTNVKDNFMRYSKRLENLNKEAGAKKVKEYHLYKQLLFLNKNVANRTDSSITGEDEDSDLETQRNETSRSRYQPTSRKRKLNDEFESELLYSEHERFQATKETENRHLSFFKAILPSLDKLNDYQTLMFQSRVLQILTDFHQPQPSTSSTDICQHPDQSFEETSNDYKPIDLLDE